MSSLSELPEIWNGSQHRIEEQRKNQSSCALYHVGGDAPEGAGGAIYDRFKTVITSGHQYKICHASQSYAQIAAARVFSGFGEDQPADEGNQPFNDEGDGGIE